jgi:hypothetical protein
LASFNPEITLAGYMAKHERAAAFTGADGHAYSCAIYVDDEPGGDGRYGAALLFVRWDDAGAAPVGHVETEFLAFGGSAAEAAHRVGLLSLYDVKAALDEAIRARAAIW